MSGYWTNERVLIFFTFYLIILIATNSKLFFLFAKHGTTTKINLKTLLNNIFRHWLAAMHVKCEILTAKERVHV